MNTKSDKTIMIKCECGTDTVEVSYLHSEDYPILEFTMWKHARASNRLSLLERVRWSLHILFTGYPWADSVIVLPKNAKKLANFINKVV